MYTYKLFYFFCLLLPVIENIIGPFDRENTIDRDFECNNIVSRFEINSQLS